MKMKLAEIKKINLLGAALALKVIADMFYNLQFLDILLLGVLGLYLVHSVCTKKLRVCVCDVLVILMGLLFTISFTKDIAYFRDYAKLISAFMLYFLGRYEYDSAEEISQALLWAYGIAFLVNVIYCFTGNGTVLWGDALTCRGMYYFKTDFAAMISYFMVFYYIKGKKYSIFDYVLLIMAGCFIVLSNARIYYMIFSVLLCCVWLYKRNKKLLAVKSIVWIAVFAIIGVMSVVILPHLPIFANRQMITLEISRGESSTVVAETVNDAGTDNGESSTAVTETVNDAGTDNGESSTVVAETVNDAGTDNGESSTAVTETVNDAGTDNGESSTAVTETVSDAKTNRNSRVYSNYTPEAILTRNLQGRNNIWGPLFDAFGEQGLMTQLFGAGLSFNDTYGFEDFNEHSLYVKIILNTGYVGLLLWLAFVILIVFYLGKEKNKRISFICAMLIGIYSVSGISVPTNLFTSTSWFPLLYCGLICGIEKSQKSVKCECELEAK